MLGPVKLSAIRAEARKAFSTSDAELLAWFNRQVEDLGQKPNANKGEMETLRLLRDALAKEAKREGPRRRKGGVTGRSKS